MLAVEDIPRRAPRKQEDYAVSHVTLLASQSGTIAETWNALAN